MDFEISSVVPDDAEDWVRTHVEAMVLAYPMMSPGFASDRRAEIDERITAARAEFAVLQSADPATRLPRRHWIARCDGRPVAVASSGWGPADWESEFPPPPREFTLDKLYLLPQVQGTGLGQAMLDIAIGDRPAYLWIMAENPRAERFYARNGFVHEGVTESSGWWGHGWLMHRMVRPQPAFGT